MFENSRIILTADTGEVWDIPAQNFGKARNYPVLLGRALLWAFGNDCSRIIRIDVLSDDGKKMETLNAGDWRRAIYI